eukprot:Trichotokara_eunicae@DN1271_c0_g1_i1.p1
MKQDLDGFGAAPSKPKKGRRGKKGQSSTQYAQQQQAAASTLGDSDESGAVAAKGGDDGVPISSWRSNIRVGDGVPLADAPILQRTDAVRSRTESFVSSLGADSVGSNDSNKSSPRGGNSTERTGTAGVPVISDGFDKRVREGSKTSQRSRMTTTPVVTPRVTMQGGSRRQSANQAGGGEETLKQQQQQQPPPHPVAVLQQHTQLATQSVGLAKIFSGREEDAMSLQ